MAKYFQDDPKSRATPVDQALREAEPVTLPGDDAIRRAERTVPPRLRIPPRINRQMNEQSQDDSTTVQKTSFLSGEDEIEIVVTKRPKNKQR